MAIATTESLEKLRISGERTLEFSAADLRRGSRYLLIEVPAGHYEIEQIRFSSWYQYDLNSDYWQFSVDAGKVSYVGELEIFTSGFRIKRNGLKLVNRSSYALEFMQEHFPNILAHNTISYRGPGEDGFLDYVNSTSFAQQQEK
ncbi:hypothetical protein [Lacimicrobium alkaliphilum]|nr:hypothetical protein [Lacimicrobium alkaliphilum]